MSLSVMLFMANFALCLHDDSLYNNCLYSMTAVLMITVYITTVIKTNFEVLLKTHFEASVEQNWNSGMKT